MNNKRFWYLIGIGVVLFFFIIVISNVIEVGLRLREISQYLEYGFYGLSGILLFVLIINPVRVILLAPTFSVEDILDDEHKRHSVYKRAAKQLLENPVLTEDDKERLRGALNDRKNLKNELTTIFQTTINAEINKVIIKNSKSVMVTTALSQNGNLDMISVIGLNLRMIKEITELTGFRPTMPKLAKLSLNVLTTALIAEGLDDAEISEMLPNKISETLTDLPFIKTISNSVMSGAANGLLTCRVGIVTQKYLFTDSDLLDKKQIRRYAIKESVKMMPSIVSGGLAAFPKGVYNIFTKPFKKKNKGDKDEETS
jgi:uncharacterized membrane protein YcjF (UPF0283 family)